MIQSSISPHITLFIVLLLLLDVSLTCGRVHRDARLPPEKGFDRISRIRSFRHASTGGGTNLEGSASEDNPSLVTVNLNISPGMKSTRSPSCPPCEVPFETEVSLDIKIASLVDILEYMSPRLDKGREEIKFFSLPLSNDRIEIVFPSRFYSDVLERGELDLLATPNV